jgi:hypothetical protein
MTNLTTNTNTTTTTTTTNEATPMTTITTTTTTTEATPMNLEQLMTNKDVNTNALSSTIAASIFHEIKDTKRSVVLACAIIEAVAKVFETEKHERFFNYIVDGVESSSLEASLSMDGKQTVTVLKAASSMTFVDTGTAPVIKIKASLIKLGYMTEANGMGDKLVELYSQRTEAYAPIEAGTAWERRFQLTPEKGQGSQLLNEAVNMLEKTEFTIDSWMLEIANAVQEAMGGATKDKESYVLNGCNQMDSAKNYVSEFKADRRIRLYQAACHGPNGQSSDRSRALMDLAGVPTDYNIDEVHEAVLAELEDMTSKKGDELVALRALAVEHPKRFVFTELAKPKKDRDASKPWSFIKAARILAMLEAGQRPYIGMAVGLDAKCSGPQYAALMVGDKEIAAACGVTLNKAPRDAYEICIDTLDAAGLEGFTRGGIKKAYMGVFYGQGWAAFTDIAQLEKDEQDEIINILYPTGIVSDDKAELFHKSIVKSFGKGMATLRERFKAFGGKIEGRTSHLMPDGCTVSMNYKHKENILGETLEHGTICPDVTINTTKGTYKFIKLAMNTLEVHTEDFIRNGFVNMIQGTDALVARLILANLNKLGAKHAIGVHDCFRVNVTEMPLLKQAIIMAYQELFGDSELTKTHNLPQGTDILALYFAGMSKSLIAGSAAPVAMPQFDKYNDRNIVSVNGNKLRDVFAKLGTSYYFAK